MKTLPHFYLYSTHLLIQILYGAKEGRSATVHICRSSWNPRNHPLDSAKVLSLSQLKKVCRVVQSLVKQFRVRWDRHILYDKGCAWPMTILTHVLKMGQRWDSKCSLNHQDGSKLLIIISRVPQFWHWYWDKLHCGKCQQILRLRSKIS